MPIVPAICTQCGAAVQVNDTLDAAICPHCQTPFIIQKAIDLKDETYKLTPLDDSLETLAHNYIVNRFSE